MRRKAAGAVLALVVGLACSACGSAGHDGANVARVVPAAHELPIRRSGVGSESLGTFAAHRWLYVKATCVGTGRLGVYWNKNGVLAACKNSRRKPTLKLDANFPVYTHRARIRVRAPAGMKWTVTLFQAPDTRATSVWR